MKMAPAGVDKNGQLFIGLMSGTSLNSIDCGLFDFSNNKISTIATHEHPLPDKLKEEILSLCSSGYDEIHRMALADRKIGELFSEAVITLLNDSGFSSEQIAAIGSHGQTIRHQPKKINKDPAYTLQIGDPHTIASLTNILTVSDFRRRDIALGGQGAPLAPAFHTFAFKSELVDRCIINIGGISNITGLPRAGDTTGFDTGPGNVLINTWIKKIKGLEFDDNGGWASTGTINQILLERFLDEPYLKLPPPKSTGRELFNEKWLMEKLGGISKTIPQDVMATLTELTALTITKGIQRISDSNCEVYLCGGGAHNNFLRQRISHHLGSNDVKTTRSLGVEEDWVEAAAFAWFAKSALEGKKIDFSTITGSRQAYPCGAIYLN